MKKILFGFFAVIGVSYLCFRLTTLVFVLASRGGVVIVFIFFLVANTVNIMWILLNKKFDGFKEYLDCRFVHRF